MVEKKTTNLKAVMEDVVKLLVDSPSRVKIESVSTDNTTFFEVLVDTKDVGTVIGPKGKHITAIRTIFMAAAAARRQRISISVNGRTD